MFSAMLWPVFDTVVICFWRCLWPVSGTVLTCFQRCCDLFSTQLWYVLSAAVTCFRHSCDMFSALLWPVFDTAVTCFRCCCDMFYGTAACWGNNFIQLMQNPSFLKSSGSLVNSGSGLCLMTKFSSACRQRMMPIKISIGWRSSRVDKENILTCSSKSPSRLLTMMNSPCPLNV